jgi:hypothetical protein
MQKFAVLNTGTSAAASSGVIYAGLDRNSGPVGDDASGITAGTTEPSSTGSYARQAITWATPVQGAADATVPALNSVAISWTSSAAYSTAANTLGLVTLWNTATLATVAEANFYGRAVIAVPQAVNASGITLTIAISGLSMGFISA